MATAACETQVSPVSNGALSMGHLALHYPVAQDGPLAACLLQIFGLHETQMLPLPGGNFYRFVVSDKHVRAGMALSFSLACRTRKAGWWRRSMKHCRSALRTNIRQRRPTVI